MAGDDREKGSLLSGYLDDLDDVETVQVSGRFREVTGLVVRAAIPEARVGDVVEISRPGGTLRAEVVGFSGDDVVLMPLGKGTDIGPNSTVESTGSVSPV